jgi:predicted ATPase
LRRWSLAKAGEGQIVLLSGEAGIGKSRLTAALLERLAAEPHTRMRYFCSPQHTASALHPIIEQLERAAGINRGDLPARKLDKLDALLAHSADLSEEAALFAEMLSLPNDGRYPALELTSQARRQRTLDALLAQIEALAHDNPVLIIFEDAHWADPTTLEFFGRLIDRVQTLNVFLFMTFRPEFVPPPWTGRPHVTALTINRLARGEVMALIDRIAGNVALSANTKLEIVERTDGVPLFVEEMTRAVLEAEGERAALRAGTAVLSSAAAVPQSLHALLTARLDRLGEAKAVAQVGAAIGREFSHELLASVARGTSGELAASLDHLVDSGLLFRGGAPPHVTYQFKHALVRDAAYGMLLREPRRALHTRIVETIEGQFADIAENQPDLLAHHCTEAGLIEKAAGLWGKAGQRSLDRSALVEAAEQLKRALGQIGALAASQALRREEIRWQIGLLNALMHVKGYAAVETKVALERARLLIDQAEALGEPPDDPLLLYSVLYGFWVASYVAFNGDVLCDLASQMLSRAEDQDATIPRMIGHRMMGASLLLTGRFAEARAHQDKAIALYRPAEHRPLATRFGQDSAVMIVSYRAIALWSLGYPDAALSGIRLAIEEAREIGQAATLIVALMHAAVVHSHCGNHADARAAADELIALADEKGISFWKTFGILIQGCVLARFNLASDAVLVISSAITDLQPTGATLWATYSLSYLAKAYAQLGKFGDAERCIGEAAAAIGATGEKWCEPEVHRVAGEIALMCPQPDATKAEACFELALAVAQGQQACSWKLRAAMSMARLWRDQGKRQQAHDLLAPVYGWFTEGLDTLDLKEAKCLLAELADNTASERG